MCMAGLTPIGIPMLGRWWMTTGRLLGSQKFGADSPGYVQLERWLRSWGQVVQVGVEGTGSYGAGLARHLTAAGVEVVEVNRPNRQLRRLRGKTDTVDAEAAARAALSGLATARPKAGDGPVEGIRMLRVARRSGVKARTQAANQIHALVVTAPEQVKHQLRGSNLRTQVRICVRWRPGETQTTIAYAKKALRHLARRYQTLDTEITQLDAEIRRLCAHTNPALLAATGVGPGSAAALLVTAGDNPERMNTEASFRGAVRPQPRPSIFRTNSPPPSQPRRRPPSQQRAMANSHQPDAHRPPNHRIHPQATSRRQNPPRDHPLPQTAHRTRDPPPPHQPNPNTARQRSTPPTSPSPTNPHRRRPTTPSPSHPHITTRTRPPPQPPAHHPIPAMAHRHHEKPDL